MLERITVGRWPRYLALSPDGKRLAVGCNGDGGVAVVGHGPASSCTWKTSAGSTSARCRSRPTEAKSISPGWSTATTRSRREHSPRLGAGQPHRAASASTSTHAREAIALDPRGEAVGDPHGLALSPDEQAAGLRGIGHARAAWSTSCPACRFRTTAARATTSTPTLLKDRERFYRIPLGGRPMAVRYSQRRRHVFVANYLLNAVQVVDVAEPQGRTDDCAGRPAEAPSLARRGEAIFYDAARSLDQWYSCHSCHYEGHTNAVADGHAATTAASATSRPC